MSDRNAYLLDVGESPWPVPSAYLSPWPMSAVAERVNAIAPAECCEGLARLLLDIVHDFDLRLAKAQFDNWTLAGLLEDKHA